MGIWIWENKFTGLPHAGSVLYQMTMKGETSAVWLEVKYKKSTILFYDGMNINLSHDGIIENLVYHTGIEKSIIVTTKISPENITMLKIYELLEIIK